jgi:hypothetical protein
MIDFSKVSQTVQSGVARYISRNALNPMLILCLITTPLFFGTAYLFKDDPAASHLLLVGGAVPTIVTIIAYIAFAIFKTDELKSETFQLRQQAMQLVAQKGKGFALSPISLEAISNPAVGLLGTGEEPERR